MGVENHGGRDVLLVSEPGLYPLAKKVHDLLMEKMKLDKDDLAVLKGDFDDLQRFNQKQILLFPDQSP